MLTIKEAKEIGIKACIDKIGGILWEKVQKLLLLQRKL